MWTLATENRKGINNRQETNPLQIDPQYVVGYTWARQYGFRVVKNFDDKFALAFAVEAPQATIGGRGFSTVTTINSAAAPATIVTSGATTATTGNFFINAPGAGGGLYNAFDANGYTVNKAPDLIFKAAADPGFGHYELFGIVSFFRDRIYPCGVVGTNSKDTAPPATPTNLQLELPFGNADGCEQLRRDQCQRHGRRNRCQRVVVSSTQEGRLWSKSRRRRRDRPLR